MDWYVRALDTARLEELGARATAIFEAAAAATGCRLEISHKGHSFSAMRNDAVMVELFAENAAALGRRMGRGADRAPGKSGSTDMANVSQIVPTIHPMLDIDAGDAVNHQREFAAATTRPGGDLAIRDGALAMAWTVVDLAVGGRWDELGG